MALAEAITWEVRTTGSDNSGGGFKTGASGTDRSQQDAAEFSGTNLAIDGADNTKVMSATHNFDAADVGNVIQVTAGTNFTPGFYEVVSTASNAATLDRAVGTVGATGGTWALGGALLTLAKVAGAYVGGNNIWVKAGTYTVTTGVTFPTSPTDISHMTKISGYGTTRGDGGRPTVATTSGITVLTVNADWVWFEHFIISGPNDGSIGIGFQCIADDCVINDVKVSGCGNTSTFPSAYLSGLHMTVVGLEVTGTGCTYQALGLNSNSIRLIGCYIHDNAAHGIAVDAGSYIGYSVIANNTGSHAGLHIANWGLVADHCIFYGNGQDGAEVTGVINAHPVFLNCLFAANGRYGINCSDANRPQPITRYCGFWSNTTADYHYVPGGTGDVILTADPFTNAAGGDFTLNTDAGGGAACRGAGYPGTVAGL